MTKAKVVELLKLMEEGAQQMSELFAAEGDDVERRIYLHHAMCYKETRMLLTNKDFAETIGSIYFKEGVTA